MNIIIPVFEEQHTEPKDAKPSVALARSQTLLRETKLLSNRHTAPLRPRFPASQLQQDSKGLWRTGMVREHGAKLRTLFPLSDTTFPHLSPTCVMPLCVGPFTASQWPQCLSLERQQGFPLTQEEPARWKHEGQSKEETNSWSHLQRENRQKQALLFLQEFLHSL